jgi:hypothetical protein
MSLAKMFDAKILAIFISVKLILADSKPKPIGNGFGFSFDFT